MKRIKIKADLWRLSPNWAVAGTRGSFGSCELIFELSHHWDNMKKRITFYPAREGEAVAVAFDGGSVAVPDEVMAHSGTAVFVLDGIAPDGKRLVSSRGELRVVDTAYPGGREPMKYAPNEVDQLRADVAALRAELEALKKEAR